MKKSKTAVEELSKRLVGEFGAGWSYRQLMFCTQFAIYFPEIEIVNTLCSQLSWSHIKVLCHDVCRSYLDLWAEWESNRDWIGPEQYVDELVADRLLAFWLMGDYDRYCPDGEFDLEAYFTLDNLGGRPCQARMDTLGEKET